MTCRAASAASNAKYTNRMFKYYYNNSNNNHTLTTAKHFHKNCYGQTDQQADIVTYRAVFTAKNAKCRI